MVRMGSRSAAYQAASVGRSGSMSSQLDWSDCEPMTDCASGRESVEQPGKTSHAHMHLRG